MMAQLTYSPEQVRDITATNDYDVVEDGQSVEHWQPDMKRNGWLLATEFGITAGLCQLTPMNGTTLEIHPTVVRELRRTHRHAVVAAFFDWIFANTKYTKLVAIIPACYRHVKRFAVEMGLVVEGNISSSTLRGGKLHDQWLLGLTRAQWEQKKCQV
jgi:hypothetical protein